MIIIILIISTNKSNIHILLPPTRPPARPPARGGMGGMGGKGGGMDSGGMCGKGGGGAAMAPVRIEQ